MNGMVRGDSLTLVCEWIGGEKNENTTKNYPICTGESLVPAYYRDKFSFCKKELLILSYSFVFHWW